MENILFQFFPLKKLSKELRILKDIHSLLAAELEKVLSIVVPVCICLEIKTQLTYMGYANLKHVDREKEHQSIQIAYIVK